MDLASSDFLDWFKRTGGEIHAAVGVVQLPDMGQGAIAIQNIAVRKQIDEGMRGNSTFQTEGYYPFYNSKIKSTLN